MQLSCECHSSAQELQRVQKTLAARLIKLDEETLGQTWPRHRLSGARVSVNEIRSLQSCEPGTRPMLSRVLVLTAVF